MNKFNRLGFAFAVVIGSLFFIGCSDRVADQPKAKNTARASQSGVEIHRDLLARYRSASSYRDQAILYLTYRLEGKAIVEQQPWSTAFDSKGRFASDLFNAKIRHDGQKLSCNVFDIATSNIDNQQVLVDAKGFDYLFDDPIVSHYLFGASELPLDTIEAQQQNRLLPPVIGFSQMDLLPPWLSSPDQIEVVPDDHSVGFACDVLKIIAQKRAYFLWVGQQSGLIEQIQFPLEYLDSQILAAEQIDNLKLFARFHDAQLGETIDDKAFLIEDRVAVKHVRRFVPLPAAPPSQAIGKEIADLQLTDTAGKEFGLAPGQQSQVLVWAPGFAVEDLVEPILRLAKIASQRNFTLHLVVAGDPKHSLDEQSRTEFAATLKQLNDGKVSVLYDPEMAALSRLKLESIPVAVVIDSSQKLQFAISAVGTNGNENDNAAWEQELATAIDRIRAGDDLASEMAQVYQRSLDRYYQALTDHSTAARTEVEERPVERFQVLWRNSELTSAGRIHVPEGSNRIFVLDGWQTVVEFDLSGKIVSRRQLDLPTGMAIEHLRSTLDGDGQLTFAGYSQLGKRICFFDQDLRTIDTLQIDSFAKEGRITQCRYVNDSEHPELWVSVLGDTGVFAIDRERKSHRIIRPGPSQDFINQGGVLYLIDDSGRLWIDGQQVDVADETSFVRLIKISGDGRNTIRSGASNVGCIAMDSEGRLARLSPEQPALRWLAVDGARTSSTVGTSVIVASQPEEDLFLISEATGLKTIKNDQSKISPMPRINPLRGMAWLEIDISGNNSVTLLMSGGNQVLSVKAHLSWSEK